MTVEHYTFLYGSLLTYDQLYSYFFPDHKADEDEVIDWISQFTKLTQINGPIPEYLREFYRSIILIPHINDRFFPRHGDRFIAISIPHDQSDDKYLVAIGIRMYPTHFEIDRDEMYPRNSDAIDTFQAIQRTFEHTTLYNLLNVQKRYIIANDCRCCT